MDDDTPATIVSGVTTNRSDGGARDAGQCQNAGVYKIVDHKCLAFDARQKSAARRCAARVLDLARAATRQAPASAPMRHTSSIAGRAPSFRPSNPVRAVAAGHKQRSPKLKMAAQYPSRLIAGMARHLLAVRKSCF